MKALKSILISILFFSSITIQAQDQIFLTNGKILEVFVTEKSNKEIKYKLFVADDSPIIVIKTYTVEKIIFRNGVQMAINTSNLSPNRLSFHAGLILGLFNESASYKAQMEYFLFPKWTLECNVNSDVENDYLNLSVGTKYFFDPMYRSKIRIYTGASIGTFDDEYRLQIPVGINYMHPRGFDLRMGFVGLSGTLNNDNEILFEALAGWRF
jgi:hypothetical protein